MRLNHRQHYMFMKVFSLFSVVRGYNLLILLIAQYLTAIFILAPNLPVRQVVLDINLLMLVLASSASVASGYIINNFYDSEKDLINRPEKTKLDHLVGQNTKLSFYFILNFIAVIMASYVSFRATLFFSAFIFTIWLYSHKLKRIVFISNLVSAILTITPFFAIFLYYKNFEYVIFFHAAFLFLILLMRELVKDLENLKGDIALGYTTIPIIKSEQFSKWIITVLIMLTLFPIYWLLTWFNVGKMALFFYITIILLGVFAMLMWRSNSKKTYLIMHSILKLIIVLGVFSIMLIDMQVILKRLF